MLSLITSASIGTLSKTLLCARHCRTYFSPCVYSGVKGQLITCRPQAPFLPLLTSASQNSSQPTLKKLAESQRSDGKHAISIKGNTDFNPADHFSLKSLRKLPGIYATLSKSYLTRVFAKKFNMEAAKDAPQLSLPGKLVFPSIDTNLGTDHFSMLGLGDIVMPGLLLCFVLRYDNYKKKKLEGDSYAPSSPSNLIYRVRYFHCTLIGYFIGLFCWSWKQTWGINSDR